jgi:gluconate 2-dehydrogenase subunit 3-like protein
MSTRREMLQTLIASVGAGAVVPLVAEDHPLHKHAADGAAVQQADAKAKSAAYKPEFLDQHQFDTLQSLAEHIVPGASKAKTSEFVDQLLAVDSPDDQRSFVSALGAFEGQAIARAGRPWKQLADADQIAILTEASTTASGRAPERPWTRGEPIDRLPAAAATVTLRDHFDLLKGWIAGAYYSSETGMRELGWTGNVVFAAFPGCDHPDGHA